MENKARKIYEKWWFYLIIIIVILTIFNLFNENEEENTDINDNVVQENIDESEVEMTEREKNKYYVIDSFINKYNTLYENHISDVIEIDIQDSAYYQTQFRLSAYDGALAKLGKIGNTSLKIINYNIENNYVEEPKSLEIYVDINTYDEMKSVFENLIKVIDNNTDNKEIEEVYNTLNTVYSTSFYPDSGIFDAYISKKNNGKYEILIHIKNTSNFLD